ncbi:hypothetical protein BST34_06470 [Mycolicibacterium monacense DSM 44395]|nr:hypothetical protein BST34_06470 [Mycolicibacterium monacense DSM 44395]
MCQRPRDPRELELAAILHRGRADGTFTHCSPEADALSIRAAFEAAFLRLRRASRKRITAQDPRQSPVLVGGR